jgi:hypothetical protein
MLFFDELTVDAREHLNAEPELTELGQETNGC